MAVKEIAASRFDNLSNLAGDLKRVEGTYIKTESPELAQVRNGVVGVLQAFNNSRLNLRRVLFQLPTSFSRCCRNGYGLKAGTLQSRERDCELPS